MNLRNLSKQELAKEWKKSDAYVYRRFSQEVDFSLTDITDVVNILDLSKKEAIDIFFWPIITQHVKKERKIWKEKTTY